MNINQLIETGADFTLSIKCSDLMEFGRMLINTVKEEAKAALHKGEEDVLLSANETMQKLQVSSRSTLWRWEKANYLLPVRAGGKVLYKSNDVERVLKIKMN